MPLLDHNRILNKVGCALHTNCLSLLVVWTGAPGAARPLCACRRQLGLGGRSTLLCFGEGQRTLIFDVSSYL